MFLNELLNIDMQSLKVTSFLGCSFEKREKKNMKKSKLSSGRKNLNQILNFEQRMDIFKDLRGFTHRIYIRGELRESLGMNFFSPFQPEREFKVYKSCKCSQIICSRVH